MGMYTQLHIGTTLKPNLSCDIVDVLNFMVGDREEEPENIPSHDLFKCDRWQYMLQCDSYYFDYKTTQLFTWDEIGNHYWFNVTCNLKNYTDEIALFLDWIYDYLDEPHADNFIGYMRYEEDDEPTLIYKDKMKRKE